MTNPKAENDFLYWYLASTKIDEALKLDLDSFQERCKDNNFRAALAQVGMTEQELRKKYWQVRLFKLLSLFKGEVEEKQNKSARQFVGEIITKAAVPAPDWYVQALIKADKSPYQSRKGKRATDTIKVKLKSAVYFALIKHYRNEKFSVRKGTSSQLVPEIFDIADSIKIEETAVKSYRKEVLEIVGSDYFADRAVMSMFIGLLKIDLTKVAQVLNIEEEDY